jgi:HSP20 family molecular chaperone IbpA
MEEWLMLLPTVFGEDLFNDDWMNDFGFAYPESNPLYGKKTKNLMKTDIKETKTGYELSVDMPGFKKDEIQAKLENGYLTISASKGVEKNDKDKEGRYIRKERYTGQCARSFYVGDALHQEDVKAKYEDGILTLAIPKKEPAKVEQKKYIAIEG